MSHLKVVNYWLSLPTLANKLNQQYKIWFNYLFTKYLNNHTELHLHRMDNILITNSVIKENGPSGRNRYDSWLHKERGLGLSERAGRLRSKKVWCLYRAVGSYAIVNTVSYAFIQLCYRKYSILCIVNNLPIWKRKIQ